MYKFNVSKDMKKINNEKRRKEVAVGKVTVYLCLTLIIKELRIIVEHGRVETTLNIIFSVVVHVSHSSASAHPKFNKHEVPDPIRSLRSHLP